MFLKLKRIKMTILHNYLIQEYHEYKKYIKGAGFKGNKDRKELYRKLEAFDWDLAY